MKVLYAGLLCSAISLHPFKIIWENADTPTNSSRSIEAAVFMNSGDFKTLKEGQKATTEVAEGVRQAAGGDVSSGDVTGEVVKGVTEITTAAASGGTADLVKAAVQVAAVPVGIAINAIIEAVTVKKTYNFDAGEPIFNWYWADIIERNGYGDNGNVFVVLMDKTDKDDQKYLGSLLVPIRGQVNFKIGTKGNLAVRAFGYDEDVPGTNLTKLYESKNYDSFK